MFGFKRTPENLWVTSWIIRQSSQCTGMHFFHFTFTLYHISMWPVTTKTVFLHDFIWSLNWLALKQLEGQVKQSQQSCCDNILKYACYWNKHQSHQTKQMSRLLDKTLNYPKTNRVVSPRKSCSPSSIIHYNFPDFFCESYMIHYKEWYSLSCNSSVSQALTQLKLQERKVFRHCSADNWTLHGSKLHLGLMDHLMGIRAVRAVEDFSVVWQMNDQSI